MDPSTGKWTRLQNLREGDGFTVPLSSVRVSPDGHTMLFVRERFRPSDRQVDREVWKCDARTGERPERVLEKGTPAAWSPDSKSFVALVEKNESVHRVVENWLMSADGQKLSVLKLPEGDAVEDWSADGQWLTVR